MMRKLIVLFLLIIMVSCDLLEPKYEYQFIYSYENKASVSNLEMQKTIEVLKVRLTSFGLQPEIKRFEDKHIEILIKASKLNIDQVDKLVTNKGKLEFWELYKGEEILRYLVDFDRKQNQIKQMDSLSRNLTEFVASTGYPSGPIIFNIKQKGVPYVDNLINLDALQQKLSIFTSKVKFLWGLPDSQGNVPLYAAKSNKENQSPLTGKAITKAYQAVGYADRPVISIEMNKEGALIWERITGKAFQNASQIAIALNDTVYSAPGVTSEAIKGGKSSISGNFTFEEAQNLAIILSSKYPIPQLKLLEQTTIENK